MLIVINGRCAKFSGYYLFTPEPEPVMNLVNFQSNQVWKSIKQTNGESSWIPLGRFPFQVSQLGLSWTIDQSR